MIAQFVPLALLTALAGCSSPEEMERELLTEATANVSATAGIGAAREVKVENDRYSFEYSYPLAVGAIAGLKAYLDDDLDKSQAELAAQAQEAQGDAKEFSYPYRPHSLIVDWKVAADLPGWLSLSRSDWTYTGGAHGNSVTSSLVWDKDVGAALNTLDLFVSPETLESAFRDSYCTALDELRAERRGEPLADDGIFGECPKLDELTLIVGSSTGESFDGIGLIADPYVAGSFAEGPYEVTLPVDAAILDTVKPTYKEAFSVRL